MIRRLHCALRGHKPGTLTYSAISFRGRHYRGRRCARCHNVIPFEATRRWGRR